jgi:hypothetical protein
MVQNKLMEELNEVDVARAPRQSREQEERPKVWQPASTLPEPEKQPGFTYRWVRVSTLGVNDARNISAALREGWEPVSIEEQPQFKFMVDPDSRFKDNIEVAGLLLCKIPRRVYGQRRKHFEEKTKLRMSPWTTTSCERTIRGCRSLQSVSPKHRLVQANKS